MTRPAVKRRALEEADRLTNLTVQRDATRPANDPVLRPHEIPHRRVTLHDEETQRVYAAAYLEEVSDLRSLFAEHGVRNSVLDAVYRTPQNSADLRTIATALTEMAGRIR